ncbi:MAG: hypothetical protein ACI8S6_005001 [Myxococcota bacterium]|jgi:hypothetical protein
MAASGAQRGALAFESQRCLETAVLFTRSRGVQEAAHRLLVSHALTSVARAQAVAAGQPFSPPHPASVDQSQARATQVLARWKGAEAAAALDVSAPLAACAELQLICSPRP